MCSNNASGHGESELVVMQICGNAYEYGAPAVVMQSCGPAFVKASTIREDGALAIVLFVINKPRNNKGEYVDTCRAKHQRNKHQRSGRHMVMPGRGIHAGSGESNSSRNNRPATSRHGRPGQAPHTPSGRAGHDRHGWSRVVSGGSITTTQVKQIRKKRLTVT